MKGIVDSASELIGKTPMLYLHNYMKEAGVEDAAIIAKLEYFNPAGSVKDRVALAMIEDAERNAIKNPACPTYWIHSPASASPTVSECTSSR